MNRFLVLCFLLLGCGESGPFMSAGETLSIDSQFAQNAIEMASEITGLPINAEGFKIIVSAEEAPTICHDPGYPGNWYGCYNNKVIELNETLNRSGFCEILVHEFMHVAGLQRESHDGDGNHNEFDWTVNHGDC